jgi:hypothetical protein
MFGFWPSTTLLVTLPLAMPVTLWYDKVPGTDHNSEYQVCSMKPKVPQKSRLKSYVESCPNSERKPIYNGPMGQSLHHKKCRKLPSPDKVHKNAVTVGVMCSAGCAQREEGEEKRKAASKLVVQDIHMTSLVLRHFLLLPRRLPPNQSAHNPTRISEEQFTRASSASPKIPIA